MESEKAIKVSCNVQLVADILISEVVDLKFDLVVLTIHKYRCSSCVDGLKELDGALSRRVQE